MEEPRFTLYWVVEKRYRRTFDTDGIIPMSIIYNIGLREDWYEAVIRAHYYAKGGEVTPESHFLLKIQFSAVGFMHYSTTSAGRDYGYSPVLYKQVYRIETRDWKVWHFQQDLPMLWEASPGVLLVSTKWIEIPMSASFSVRV